MFIPSKRLNSSECTTITSQSGPGKQDRGIPHST